MKKIVFPSDFSAHSIEAFQYALEIAHHIQAEIYVLHTYSVSSLNIESEGDFQDIISTTDKYISQVLSEQIPVFEAMNQVMDQPLTIHYETYYGNFEQAVEEYAQWIKADYIFLGTKGALGMKRFFLGTHTSALIDVSTLPILIIPQGIRYKPLKQISFSSTGTEEDISYLKILVEFASHFDAEVRCVHVYKDTPPEINVEDWKFLIPRCSIKFDFVKDDSVVDALLDFADEQTIDMMCMVHRKRTFIEDLFYQSKTKQVSYQMEIPLLCLPYKSIS